MAKEGKKMKKRYKIPMIAVGVFVALIIGLVGFKAVQMGIMMPSDEEIEANNNAENIVLDVEGIFSERDLVQEVDLGSAEDLVLVSGEDVIITAEGTYVLSGTYEDVMIQVEVADNEKVQLVFDGLTVTNLDKPVVYVKEADKVFVTTTSSTSSLEVTGTIANDGDTNLDAVIFSRSDITFNGLGTLVITSSENAINAKDDLKVTGGSYEITAENHGFEANDSVRIYDGELTIDSNNDAIHSENEEDESLGYVYIQGGLLNIKAAVDGIRGNSAIQIDGGTINIEECGEGLEATRIEINDGVINIYSVDDGINATYKTSYRVVVQINGGEINIEMADGDTDGIDSNGDFTMTGGTVNVIGGMAAFDIDGVIEFTGGEVYVDGVQQTEISTQSFGIGSFANRGK